MATEDEFRNFIDERWAEIVSRMDLPQILRVEDAQRVSRLAQMWIDAAEREADDSGL